MRESVRPQWRREMMLMMLMPLLLLRWLYLMTHEREKASHGAGTKSLMTD
jgi:hypothetical protein